MQSSQCGRYKQVNLLNSRAGNDYGSLSEGALDELLLRSYYVLRIRHSLSTLFNDQ